MNDLGREVAIRLELVEAALEVIRESIDETERARDLAVRLADASGDLEMDGSVPLGVWIDGPAARLGPADQLTTGDLYRHELVLPDGRVATQVYAVAGTMGYWEPTLPPGQYVYRITSPDGLVVHEEEVER